MVTQAVTIAAYGERIVDDYARYTTGTVLLETADRLVVEEHEPATQQHLLLVGALRALSSGDREPGLVLDSFLLRSLAISGYAPSFDECAKCGRPGPHRAFNPPAGGMVCGGCRPPASAMPAARHRRPARPHCSPATGRWPRRPSRGPGARPAGWSPPSSPGTSTAASARYPTWTSPATREPVTPRPRDDYATEPCGTTHTVGWPVTSVTMSKSES